MHNIIVKYIQSGVCYMKIRAARLEALRIVCAYWHTLYHTQPHHEGK